MRSAAVVIAVACALWTDAALDSYRNPWVQITMDGVPKKLILSHLTQGIVLFQDIDASQQIHRSSIVSIANAKSTQTMIKIIRRPRQNVSWPIDGVIGVGIKSTRNEIVWPYVNSSDEFNVLYSYKGMDIATGMASLQYGPPNGEVFWSSPMNNLEDFFYRRYTSFLMYKLSMCGQSIMEPISTYWNVALDFRSPCLTLPKEFYNTLLAWGPFTYNSTLNLTVIDEGINVSSLPAFQFQISHFSPRLTLPLRDLVLPYNQSLLCIQPGESTRRVIVERNADFPEEVDFFGETTTDLRVPNMYRSRIIFGTIVLQSLGYVLHANTTQIGFIMKPNDPEVTGNTCKTRVQCIGQQRYRRDKNSCADPNCDKWFHHKLDIETRTCVSHPFWQIFAILIIGVCSAYELYFDYIRTRWSQRYIRA